MLFSLDQNLTAWTKLAEQGKLYNLNWWNLYLISESKIELPTALNSKSGNNIQLILEKLLNKNWNMLLSPEELGKEPWRRILSTKMLLKNKFSNCKLKLPKRKYPKNEGVDRICSLCSMCAVYVISCSSIEKYNTQYPFWIQS